MAIVKLVDKSALDDDLVALYERFEATYGFVPNILRALANSPDLLRAFAPLMVSVFVSAPIGSRHRALAALATSRVTACAY